MNSTAENSVASSKAVKSAYDLANTAKSAAATAQTAANNAKTAADTYKSEILTTINNPDGGLNLVNNKLSVDFSQMPTDKFEALLKTIRVPIWLEKNTSFYVNGSTGSDTLDEGRGLSSSKPFKTIQACIYYICDNYNFSRYTVYVNISSGTYNERVVIPNYNTTGGILYIKGEGKDKTFITSSNSYVVSCRSSDNATIEGLTLHGKYSSTNRISTGVLYVETQSEITIRNTKVIVDFPDGIDAVTTNSYIVGITAHDNSKTAFGSGNEILTSGLTSIPSSSPIRHITSSGSLVFNGDGRELNEEILTASGYCTDFIYIGGSGSKCTRSSVYLPTIKDNGVYGRRFNVSNSGTISIYDQTTDKTYFPGTIAGTVDTATYSWYK